MKKLIAIFCVLAPFFAISQTIQLEKDYMNNLLLTKEKTGLEVTELNNKFQDFIKENTYPELPYNKELKIFEFVQVSEIKVSKGVAFNRVLEWVAINFGNIGDVLHYNNIDDGKIIVKGVLNLANKADYKNFWGVLKESAEISIGKFTTAITIKENKIKIEFLNFEYSSSYYDVISHTWIPLNMYSPAEALFPVIKFPENQWKRNISLLEATDYDVKATAKSIVAYINGSQDDYNF